MNIKYIEKSGVEQFKKLGIAQLKLFSFWTFIQAIFVATVILGVAGLSFLYSDITTRVLAGAETEWIITASVILKTGMLALIGLSIYPWFATPPPCIYEDNTSSSARELPPNLQKELKRKVKVDWSLIFMRLLTHTLFGIARVIMLFIFLYLIATNGATILDSFSENLYEYRVFENPMSRLVPVIDLSVTSDIILLSFIIFGIALITDILEYMGIGTEIRDHFRGSRTNKDKIDVKDIGEKM